MKIDLIDSVLKRFPSNDKSRKNDHDMYIFIEYIFMRWCMSIIYFLWYTVHWSFRADYLVFSLYRRVQRGNTQTLISDVLICRATAPNILDLVVRCRLKNTGKNVITRPEVYALESRKLPLKPAEKQTNVDRRDRLSRRWDHLVSVILRNYDNVAVGGRRAYWIFQKKQKPFVPNEFVSDVVASSRSNSSRPPPIWRASFFPGILTENNNEIIKVNPKLESILTVRLCPGRPPPTRAREVIVVVVVVVVIIS